ncbi:response regulator [Yinghuangia sp. YIM S09857]|uniref:response regulator n=1 Tax=Yinghuangia sp. YIM S09857 TaxID=3436929 RepID=UPI003F53620E
MPGEPDRRRPADTPGVPGGAVARGTDAPAAGYGPIGDPELRRLLAGLTAVRDGDFGTRLPGEPDGLLGEIVIVFNGMVDQLGLFTSEVTRVAREVGTEGILGGQAQLPSVGGAWRDLTASVNLMASNLTGQVRNIAQVATAVAKGDLTRKIDVDARGEILELKTTINTMVDQLSAFAAEVTRVAREVGSHGRLGGQAEVEGVSGTWKRLTENVNELAGNLTRQVRAIAEVTSAVAEGDLTRSITVDASGEVAELKDNINFMVRSLRESTRANQDQDWLKSNLAHVSGLMQGQRDLAVVAALVMDELTPLVGAQYGAFYLAQDSADGAELTLIGAYGLPPDGAPAARVRHGSTLVGQAARTRRTIAVEDVPGDYIVSSGLGRASPRALIVLPIVAEGEVLGVVELASVTEFTAIHRDFLEQLRETVGVNINTIVANARTAELLGESQRLAGELRARSEELQNQQEELQRSNAELEEKAALLASQNRDIEAKNEQIELARQELEDRAGQLTVASTYKSEFLANMSHELRTPLNSLLILAQLLAQNPADNLTRKQVEYASIIHSAGSDLLQLINDILDLSKVEAGKMDVHPERVPLRGLLDFVDATIRPMSAQKHLALRVAAASDAPNELITDDARLRQILRNLLSNAVKFTERGEIELRIDLAAAEEIPDGVAQGEPAVAFRVRDTGVGIPAHQLDTIFGAFQQADGTTGRRYGGTGLGLSISREIAYLLGGAVTAESAVDRGSTFTLYLPVTHPGFTEPAPEFERAPASDGSGGSGGSGSGGSGGVNRDAGRAGSAGDRAAPPPARRVLVVEEGARGLLAMIAASVGEDVEADVRQEIDIVSVADPQAAVEALGAQPYCCVVVDLGLPDDEALRLLAALDGDPRLSEAPVLLHRGRSLSQEARNALLSRPDGPAREIVSGLDELRERIRSYVAEDRPGAVETGPPADTRPVLPPTAARDDALAGRTVMVVDDDLRNQYALTGILESQGAAVLQADNGRDCVALLAAHPETDLVLMDVMMPEMDGYNATSEIHRMPGFAELPVITVTAKAMLGDREDALAAGAVDYITKPVDVDDLLDRVRRALRQ